MKPPRPFQVFATAVIVAGAGLHASGQSGKAVSIDDDPILGDVNARVTIVEFSDYQCPFCRIFWKNTFPQIKQQYIDTGKVRFVFRDYPQSKEHPQANMAAMAAQCASDQGKYWEYHDKLFAEQDTRGKDVIRFKADDLKRWAAEIGIEEMAFNRCVDSGKHQKEVADDYSDGWKRGVDGTPAFFINGRRLVGAQPFAAFQKIIEEELAAGPPANRPPP